MGDSVNVKKTDVDNLDTSAQKYKELNEHLYNDNMKMISRIQELECMLEEKENTLKIKNETIEKIKEVQESLQQKVFELQRKVSVQVLMTKELEEDNVKLQDQVNNENKERKSKESEIVFLKSQVSLFEQRLMDDASDFEKYKEQQMLQQDSLSSSAAVGTDVNRKSCFQDELMIERLESQKIEIDNLEVLVQTYKEMTKTMQDDNTKMKSKIQEFEQLVKEKENLLQSKIETIEEMKEIQENLREEKLIMSSELAILKSNSSNADARGNSLFAEVEDNRKQMAAKLRQIQAKYYALKKAYISKNSEIGRVKEQQNYMYREWHDVNEARQKNDKDLVSAHLARIADMAKEISILEMRPESPQFIPLQSETPLKHKWVHDLVDAKRKEANDLRKELQARSLKDWTLHRKLHQTTSELLDVKQQLIEGKVLKDSNRDNMEKKDVSTSPNLHKTDLNSLGKENGIKKTIRFVDTENQ